MTQAPIRSAGSISDGRYFAQHPTEQSLLESIFSNRQYFDWPRTLDTETCIRTGSTSWMMNGATVPLPRKSIIIYRYCYPASTLLGLAKTPEIEKFAEGLLTPREAWSVALSCRIQN